MSRFNFIVDDPSAWENKCMICVGMQKGWNFSIMRDRLERIDTDGSDKKMDILLNINPDLPFNDAIGMINGSNVCLTHATTIAYVKQKASKLVTASADLPAAFRRGG